MAAYRFSAQVIGRSKGRSATAAAAYRSGERLTDERTGLTHDYRARGGVLHTEILAPENAPASLHDRAALWNAVERAEKRKDAQVARDILLSLPHELTGAQRLELVRGFVQAEWVARGMVADIALHMPHREGDNRNHHAHVMLTMREVGPDGFGAKVRDWNDAALLERWREQWAIHQNRALERAGQSERVDHRSLEARGSDHEPEPKQGPVATEMERNGKRSKAGDDRRAVQARNQAREEIKAEAQVIDLALARIDREERAQRERQERQEQARRQAEAAAKLTKIEARRQAQARAAIRSAAIRLRELKEQRQETQARHDAAYAGRQEESQRFRQDREEGRKALFDRFQHAIDQVWNPEGGPTRASPDLSPLHEVNARLNVNRAEFDRREGSAWGRVRNALDAVGKWPGASEMVRLILSRDARRQGFERQQRRLYAQLVPKAQPPKVTARPHTPSPKSVQSAKLKDMRREAMAEYDRETKAGAAAMQGRHQFQRSAETAEKAALRQAQAEAGAAMDAAKAMQAGAMQGEAQSEQREATSGQPIRSGAGGISPGMAGEAGKAFRGHNPSAGHSEATQRPSQGQDGHVAGGAGDPAEGKPSRSPATWTQEGQAGESRVSAPEAEGQPPPQPDQAQARTADEQAEADRQALERLLARTDAEIAARDAAAEAEQQRQAEQGGRERGL